MTLFAELVAAHEAVAATRSRLAKRAALAAVIARLEPSEIEAAVAFLAGEARQGRIGVGWATAFASRIDEHSTAAQLTVGDVDAAFAELREMVGEGSVGARSGRLARLFGAATLSEAEFLRRLLTGGIRQGALESMVAEGVAAAAEVPVDAVRRAAMLAGSLPHVAVIALTEGLTGLAAVGLEPLRAVQPMLAATSASVAAGIDDAGDGRPVSVEWKLDGVRVQAHKRGDEVRLFTRNLNDVTARLSGIAGVVRALPAEALVLDGEAIGWAESDVEAPNAFQATMSSFGQHDGVAGGGLAVRFFDLLHLDGRDLIDEPLRDRIGALEALAGPTWTMPRAIADPADPESLERAAAFADDALARGHEGVMVKDLASAYDAGRRGGSWRKVKPVRTFDLVVLAAEWGHGRRQGWLSNLHLGARDPDTGGFVMVGKTFKGLTDALLTWQTERFLELEERRTQGTVWVRPEQVVEIAIDGVQTSARYPGGIALRFARVKRYRDDKPASEADTIGSLQALRPGG